jgi:hypothetical protein
MCFGRSGLEALALPDLPRPAGAGGHGTASVVYDLFGYGRIATVTCMGKRSAEALCGSDHGLVAADTWLVAPLVLLQA